MKMPRSIRYSTLRPADLHVGTSCHDCVAVTLFGYGIALESNTHSGRNAPERQWATASIGLLTVLSTCLPTSCTATSPPPLNGTYVIFLPVAFSSATVTIWSSCFEPVPAILNWPFWPALIAATYSCAVLYGASAFTHRTNSSSASIATGVRSFQLNGTPVASGVVNRLDNVMMILCGSPFAPLTARKPSAPAPPDLFTTISGCFIRLFLVTTPCSRRAIWSAPPPVPAGTTNSTGFEGSHAAPKAGKHEAAVSTQSTRSTRRRVAAKFSISHLLGGCCFVS